jgi:hypothetical protein
MKHTLKKSLSLLLSILMIITVIPFTASAVDMNTQVKFTVTNNGNVFTITRSDTSTAQIVSYRTISKTALAGVHFNMVGGDLSFAVGESSKSITVTERAPSAVSVANRYQTESNRYYEFEVFNQIGQVLAYCRRNMSNYTANLSMSNRVFSGSFNSTVRLADASIAPNSEPLAYDTSNDKDGTTIRTYTKEVTVINSTTVVTDDGFDVNGPFNVSTDAFFTNAGISKEYLVSAGAELYLKPYLHMAEINDGYQYIQMLYDNPTTFDDNADNGNPGTISKATYLCGFEHGTSFDDSWSYYSFPYREENSGRFEMLFLSSHKFDQQKVNSAYGRIDSTSAAIVIPASASQLNFRLDASGSGDDDWQLDSLKVRGIVVDKTGPRLVNAYVAPGNYRNGQYISVSLEFNEAVFSAPSDLVTSFGTLHSEGANRNNVVVYSGQVNGTVGAAFSLSGFNPNSSTAVTDMFGSSASPYFPTGSINNVRIVARETPQQSGNTYNITNVNELMSFIDIANQNPSANGLIMNDIDVNPDGRYRIVLDQIGTNTDGFLGTVMGLGQRTISNLSLKSGLFKKIGTTGNVKNITVSTAAQSMSNGLNGMLCYENNGTIDHCEVAGITTENKKIMVSQSATGLGFVAGTNNGTITDCRVCGNYSFDKGNSVGHLTNIGGIAVENYGSISSCLFVGDFNLPSSYTGYMGTVCVYNRSGGSVTSSFGKYTDTYNYNPVYNNNSNAALTNSEKVSVAQLASGEVTWKLNEGVTDNTQTWYQSIDNGRTPDPYPVYSIGIVYKHGNIYTNDGIIHVLSHVDEVPATCLDDGVAEHWVCTVDGCEAVFSANSVSSETTLSALTLTALGHAWSDEWSNDADDHWHECTRCHEKKDEAAHEFGSWTPAGGITISRTCSVCGAEFSQDCAHESKTEIPYQAPDCFTAGNNKYYHCNTCQNYLKADGVTVTTPEAEVIPSFGGHNFGTDYYSDDTQHWRFCVNPGCGTEERADHTFGEATYTWAADYSTVTASHSCTVCGKTVSESVDTTSSVISAATCTHGTIIRYTATFSNAFATQTKDVESTVPLGHAYSHAIYLWSADNSQVTATRTCSDCGYVEDETVSTTSEITTAATCTEAGVRTYTAVFTIPAFATQTKTETVPATGHNYGMPAYVWSADNSGVTASRTCIACGKVESETVSTASVCTATCTEPGVITYTAVFTNSGFETQTRTVAAEPLGHSYGNWTPVSGTTITATCSVCGEVTTEECTHENKVEIPYLAPDCLTGGHNKYYHCDICQNYLKEDGVTLTTPEAELIPSFGGHSFDTAYQSDDSQHWRVCTNPGCGTQERADHTFGEVTYTWAADNSTVTASHSCTVCGKTVSESVNATSSVTSATCTQEGVITYNATFTKPGFEAQTKTQTVPTLAHSYGEPQWTWNGFSSATAEFVCSVCQHTTTETATVTSETTGNTTVYTAQVTLNGTPYTDTKKFIGENLTLGENTVLVEKFNTSNYYFTPAEDGYYSFAFSSPTNMYMDIYDLGSNLGSGFGYSVSFSVYLSAGKTYEVGTFGFDGNAPETSEASLTVSRPLLHSITVTTNNAHGSAKVTTENGIEISGAPDDVRLYLDVTLEPGYGVESIVITDSDNNTCTLDEYYVFRMAYSDVNISVNFAAVNYLTLGENTVSMGVTNNTYYFLPSADGWYAMNSTGSYSIYMDIFDGHKTVGHGAPEGEGISFSYTGYLEGGKLYRINLTGNNESTADVPVVIEKLTSYSLNTDSSVEHGTVSFTDYSDSYIINEALSGTKVFIRTTPDAGYKLDTGSLSILDSDGNPVNIIEDEYFIMPESDITVFADFVPIPPLSIGENSVKITHYIYEEYRFTPAEDGDYLFRSEGDYDPRIEIFDGEVSVGSDDDSNGSNFSLVTNLKGGKTYRVVIYSYSGSGNIPVFVQKVSKHTVTLGTVTGNGTADLGMPQITQYEGTTVSVNLNSGDGWTVGSIKLTNDTTGEVTAVGNSFPMPGYDCTVSVEFVPIPELSLGENEVLTLSHVYQCYTFTPTDDGWYHFATTGGYNPYSYIYDYNISCIYSGYAKEEYNLDCFLQLEGGKTYEIWTYGYDEGSSGVDSIVITAVPQAYSITVDTTVENGTASAVAYGDYNYNPINELPAGALFYPYFVADSGYVLLNYRVTDSDGNTVYLERDEYMGCFIMPAEDIYITAEFIEKSELEQVCVNPQLWGDNIYWSLNNGVLRISGTGAIMEGPNTNGYTHYYPWLDLLDSADTVFIEDGVTVIPYYAFCGDDNYYRTLMLGADVERIGGNAFAYAYYLENVFIHTSLESIGKDSFDDCDSINDVYYYGSQSDWAQIDIHPYGNAYLQAANIHFNYVPDYSVEPLDINEDGVIDFADVAFMVAYFNNDVGSITDRQLEKMDLVYDGRINGLDQAMLYDIVTHASSIMLILGDVNTDGSTDLSDYAMIKAYVSGVGVDENTPADLLSSDYLGSQYLPLVDKYGEGSVYTPQFALADLNSDGAVDAFDLFEMDKSLNGIVQPRFTYDLDGNNAVITSYIGRDPVMLIPAGIDSHDVTKIGQRAFKDNTLITGAVIPGSVETVDNYAFMGCSNLKKVCLQDGVTRVNYGAFLNCTSLNTVELPDTVTNIGSYAFKGCTSLTKLTIPSSVTSIQATAFDSCPNLTIYCEANSYAKTFAEANGIPYVVQNIVIK